MARFSPLFLPSHITNLPQGYGQRLFFFDDTIEVTSLKHMVKVIDFIDLEEIDNDDAKIRIIAQSVLGDVKTWLRNLTPNSVSNPQNLSNFLLVKWEERKNPLQVVAEYEALRRCPNEYVQYFTTRFKNIYNLIANDIKLPPGLTLLHYLDAFDLDMAYQLREISLTIIEEMQRNGVWRKISRLRSKQ